MQIRTLALLALLAAAPAQAQERFSIPGRSVAVYNIAGTVTIERGTGDNVVVEVTRSGRDAAQLRPERRTVDGHAALVVRYPDDDVVYSRLGRGNTTMNVRDDGTFFGSGQRGDRVTIRGSGSGTEAHADLRILVPAGRELFLKLGVGSVSAASVDGGLDIDVAAANVQTSSTRGRLVIDTGSGVVRVNGAEGDVAIDTGSGDVEVNDVRGQRLLVDTGSGAVSGRGIHAPAVEVDTGSGSVVLADVSAADVEIDTGSGRVDLDLARQADQVVIDTGSGSVRLAVPADFGATLDLDTSSGGITTEMPVSVTRQERNRLVGTIGNGHGRVVVDTGSGGIRLVRR